MSRRILHKFNMDEISGVDRMAQEGAKMVLMKRYDPDEIAKGAFKEALFVMEVEDVLNEAYWAMWESDETMRRAIYNILDNPTKYPDTQAAIIEAVGEYSEKVQEQAADAAAAVPNVDDGNPSSDDPTNKSDHSDGDDDPNNPEEDNAMAKTAPTVETLTADLVAAGDKFEKAEAFGKLNDAEKIHYATLDEAGQADFMKMDEGARANVLEKAAEADSVVYTSADGEEFRKSDDPRLVTMAKKGDEDRKMAKADREKAEKLTLEKRADDELSHLPGDAEVKVQLLKAVGEITDETTRTKVNELLKAGDTAMSKAFDTRGTADAPVGDAESQLNTLAKAYAAEKDVPFADAMTKVLETEEGEALYTQSQS